MLQTISVTEARDNFPALVRRVAEQDESVIVTSHSQPRAVLVPWGTYQQQQRLQAEGAQHRLQQVVAEMEQLVAELQEAFRPNSFDLMQGAQSLSTLTQDAWAACRLLDKARRHLASILADGLQNLVESNAQLTFAQLAQLMAIFPLFRRADLTNAQVAEADIAFVKVGFYSILPIGDELVVHYQIPIEEQA